MDKRKYTIYAVDFDGTLCEGTFPGIGKPNMALINHLVKRKKQGNKIILWTCRENERLQEAVEWCGEFGLEFDTVNENLPEMVEFWGGASRKVFADVYIDDKAVNKPEYCIPFSDDADYVLRGVADALREAAREAWRERWGVVTDWGLGKAPTAGEPHIINPERGRSHDPELHTDKRGICPAGGHTAGPDARDQHRARGKVCRSPRVRAGEPSGEGGPRG